MDLHANQHPPEQAVPPPGRRQQLRAARAELDTFTPSHFHELPGRSNVVWCFMDYNKCAPVLHLAPEEPAEPVAWAQPRCCMLWRPGLCCLQTFQAPPSRVATAAAVRVAVATVRSRAQQMPGLLCSACPLA